jgi:hypothetical protein
MGPFVTGVYCRFSPGLGNVETQSVAPGLWRWFEDNQNGISVHTAGCMLQCLWWHPGWQSKICHVHTLKMEAASSSNMSALHAHSLSYPTRLHSFPLAQPWEPQISLLYFFCPCFHCLLLWEETTSPFYSDMFNVPEQLIVVTGRILNQILNKQSVAVYNWNIMYISVDMCMSQPDQIPLLSGLNLFCHPHLSGSLTE